jgi:trehalose 6-phosphate phosphatase
MATPDVADATMDSFAKLDPKQIALLLDVDGTLVDIAPSPDEVHVSDELIDSLQRLLAMTGGALALVSGRPLADLDRLFSPLKLPAVGGHGAETRVAPGEAISRIPDMPAALRQKLIAAVTPGSGLQYEDKGYSVALHYRNAPREAERLRRHIAEVRAAFPDENTQLLLGKAMFELKRPGINKGAAVKKLMTRPPFAGRTPVFLGDDVTDESVFALLPEMRGIGFSVGRHFDGLAGIFESPGDVRRALRHLAARAQDASA